MTIQQLIPHTDRPVWLGQPLTLDQPYDLIAVEPDTDDQGRSVVSGACQGVNPGGTPAQVRPTSHTLLSPVERELAIAALLAHRAHQGQVMARNVTLGMILDLAPHVDVLGLSPLLNGQPTDRPYWVTSPAKLCDDGHTAEITVMCGLHQPSVTLWIEPSYMLTLAQAAR